jgi:hypothetical protein
MTIWRQLVEDLSWCWWTQPRATRIGDLLYVGGIASDGGVFAAAYDLADGSCCRSILAQVEPDDHNNPALLVACGKPPIAFYSRHDADDVLRLRIAERADDVAAWGRERELRFGGITTYAQAHATGEEIHLFTRVDDTAWGYARSPDWGETWSDPVAFIELDTDQETYMPTALLADGRTLRVAIAGHPKNYEQRPWHRIGAVVVDLHAGVVTRPGDGQAVANIRTCADLPLRDSHLEHVCDAGEGRTLNLFDVGRGDVFEIAFASKRDGDDRTEDARYHVASNGGAGWHVEEIAPAGRTFGYIHAGFYVGGIAFSEEIGGTVYVSREHEGCWHLERWERQAEGRWVPRPLVEPSPSRLVRPWPVRNPTPELEVVALSVERYDDDYMETLSHLVGGAVNGAR